MQRFDYDIIGTHLTLLIDSDEEDCSTIFSNITDQLLRFEKKFSRFIEGNWLSNLNKDRCGILDSDALYMLDSAREISRKTNGYFDLTVGKRLMELGYGLALHLEDIGSSNREKGYGDYRDIEIIGDRVFLHGDIYLEFGGVGKGYLIDILKKHLGKFSRYLINFGGDMYGCGGWKIGLESPFALDELVGVIGLDDMFLACSAGSRRKWAEHHHLIDPHTGMSAREIAATYIEGQSGIIADSYATALCVMPWDIAIDTLQKTPEISGIILKYDGTFFQKEGSKSKVF